MEDRSLRLKRENKITPFSKSVYELTRKIPKGKITTYKLLAKGLGNPNACRAVGTALKNNPFDSKEVPCHRVVPSNYSIGCYFGKKQDDPKNTKKKILSEEGIEFEINSVKKCKKYRKNVTFVFDE